MLGLNWSSQRPSLQEAYRGPHPVCPDASGIVGSAGAGQNSVPSEDRDVDRDDVGERAGDGAESDIPHYRAIGALRYNLCFGNGAAEAKHCQRP